MKRDEDSKIVEDMEEWETPELIRIRKRKNALHVKHMIIRVE
jgi:hypothetical protein